MKTRIPLLLAALLLVITTGCDAFRTLSNSRLKTAQGKPYELIVVCPQQQWDGVLGDTLRSVLTAPVPFLNQTEPLFDVLRVNERGFTGIIADHRNILQVVTDPSLAQTAAAVQYDVTAEPQVVVTLQGPDAQSITDYVAQNGASIVSAFEQAERDRAVKFAEKFNEAPVSKAIKTTFGVDMDVPKGYVVAERKKDFLWARFEYPTASQGFFIYTYPYQGSQSLSREALLAARNKYAAQIPGPVDGSYMTTSEELGPDYRMFRLEGRIWCELRGFWDVQGDFMGGPFVSYSTVDTQTNQVFTLDCYVFSPKLHKRNFIRGVEHLLYMIRFPDTPPAQE